MGLRLFLCLALIMLSACGGASDKTEPRWENLFDGESLNGWHIVNGDLPFTVENGEIIGKTAAGIPTRYLATNEQYGDFILEAEMNNAKGANSGIQFRSIKAPQFRAGLTGYQMEVDPSPRAWTGGIFYEGLGRWRHPPTENPECVSAWKKDGWNRLRIEAKGTLLRTFVNEQPCTYLYDDTLSKGYIALQIHSVANNMGVPGAATHWRNIRILENPLEADYSRANKNVPSVSYLTDQLSPHEEANNWVLFSRETIGGKDWAAMDIVNPATNARKQSHVLKVDNAKGETLISLPNSKNGYELIADVQMAPNTKGRISYSIQDNQEMLCMSSFAIFDDTTLDYKNSDADYLMGSIIGKVSAKNLSEVNRKKRVLKPGAWQRIRIIVDGPHIEHWLNMVKVADYTDENCNASNSERDLKIEIEKGYLNLRPIKYKPL